MNMINLSKQEVVNAFKKGKLTVCVVGLGRIGLPTAAVLADAGAKVIGVDIDAGVVKRVNSGASSYRDEHGLIDLIRKTVDEGMLKATTDILSAVSTSEFIIVCVPTPVDENKVPDYSAITETCRRITEGLRRGSVVIIESTVGPGTVERLVVPLLERTGMKAGVDFGVASCPERANPGQILHTLETVPRIVGGINRQTTEAVAALYESTLGAKILKLSSPKTANAVKLTENIFRDANIALMNELAVLYEKLNIDIIEVINACATKWNFTPHYPGPGVGGPCLPANPYYLIYEGIKVGYIPHLIRMAREVNDRMPEHAITLITEALNDVKKYVNGSRIAILGVSYKPNVHDLQMTPIKRIYQGLKSMGATIAVYDPMFKGEEILDLRVAKTLNEAIRGADCILIGTDHEEFKNLDLATLAKVANMPSALVDTRNVVTPSKVKEHGFSYRGIGRTLLR